MSIPSPVAQMSTSQTSKSLSTDETLNSNKRFESRTKVRKDITRLLNNDRTVLREARNMAEDSWYRTDLEPDVLEQKLVNAALDKLVERRAAKQDIGAVFSAFKNYIPPIVYGRSARGDSERQRLIEAQLDTLCGRQHRARRDEESDDDEPNPFLKRLEGEDPQQLGDIPAYEPGRKAGATRYEAAAYGKMGYESYCGKAFGTKKRPSAVRAPLRDSSSVTEQSNDGYSSASEVDADSDSEDDDEEDEDVPLVAVMRCLPLATNSSMSGSSAVHPKHRFSASTECVQQAVLRGQVINEDDGEREWVWVEKRGLIPRKRVRETEVDDHKPEGQHKKAKVEPEA